MGRIDQLSVFKRSARSQRSNWCKLEDHWIIITDYNREKQTPPHMLYKWGGVQQLTPNNTRDEPACLMKIFTLEKDLIN